MKQKAPQAPVIPHSVLFGAIATAPLLIFDGSGVIDIVMCALGATAGVIFGDSNSMSLASASNAFPIGTEWVRMPLNRATRYMSAVALVGTSGTLYYYFPGQTEV
jgi:hypothetical protein